MLGGCLTQVLLCTLGALTVRGDNSVIVTANNFIQGHKEVGEILVFAGHDDRTWIKEIFVDSTLTKFKKAGNFFKQLGAGFAALTLFTDLIFGTVEEARHNQLLKEFEKVNRKLDQLGYQIKASTERIVDQIWTSHVLTWVATLETTSSVWNNYRKTMATEYKEQIIKLYSDNKIKTAVIGLKNSVGKNARSIGKSSGGDCKKIVLFKSYITSMLLKPYEAFKAGCVWNSMKTNGMNVLWATSICSIDNLPDVQSEIYKPIDDEIRECRSYSSVKANLEAWIDDSNNVHSGQTFLETKMSIEGVMKDRFPWMDFMLLIYDPIHGSKRHWVDNDIHKFRFRDRNIAIKFKSSECTNWPKCKKIEESCPPRGICAFQGESCDLYLIYRFPSAKIVYEILEMEWNNLKKTPLSPMIIKHMDIYDWLIQQGHDFGYGYQLGYVDNKYNVCQHRIGKFDAFLFF